jgi:hypothetical protein
VNTGTKQGFTSIDITDSNHDRWIHQKGLDRPASCRCRSRQGRSFDRWIEGLYPETGEMSVLAQARRRPDQDQAESARISKTQLAPTVEVKAQVLVRLTRVARGCNGQTAAHPQMDHQSRRPVEVDQQIFRPPPETTNESALAPPAQISGPDALTQIETRSQAATKDFYLRELRHAKIVACVPPLRSSESLICLRIPVGLTPETGPADSKTEHG